MTYLAIDNTGRAHVVPKGFACTTQELLREIATHLGVSKGGLTFQAFGSAEGAQANADAINAGLMMPKWAQGGRT